MKTKSKHNNTPSKKHPYFIEGRQALDNMSEQSERDSTTLDEALQESEILLNNGLSILGLTRQDLAQHSTTTALSAFFSNIVSYLQAMIKEPSPQNMPETDAENAVFSDDMPLNDEFMDCYLPCKEATRGITLNEINSMPPSISNIATTLSNSFEASEQSSSSEVDFFTPSTSDDLTEQLFNGQVLREDSPVVKRISSSAKVAAPVSFTPYTLPGFSARLSTHPSTTRSHAQTNQQTQEQDRLPKVKARNPLDMLFTVLDADAKVTSFEQAVARLLSSKTPKIS